MVIPCKGLTDSTRFISPDPDRTVEGAAASSGEETERLAEAPVARERPRVGWPLVGETTDGDLGCAPDGPR